MTVENPAFKEAFHPVWKIPYMCWIIFDGVSLPPAGSFHPHLDPPLLPIAADQTSVVAAVESSS
jgi:hypothetical protein